MDRVIDQESEMRHTCANKGVKAASRLCWLFALALSACQIGVPPTATVTPSPVVIPTPTSDGARTPPAGQITWLEAEALILSGQVKQVNQLHSLKVTLHLTNGKTVVTTEPSIDDVVKVIERCGKPCDGIGFSTE